MVFPLGKPVLVLMIAASLSGIAVLLHRPARKADLTLWTFARDRGFELDPSILKSYQQRTGRSVSVKVVLASALDTRLVSLFMKSGHDAQSPDLVEVEISSVGKFFRPPVADIGFLPWNDYLQSNGLLSEFLPARLNMWSKDGQIFGLPQDVHPVSLTYRKDLFDAAGVDPRMAKTWPQLQQLCLQFENFWHAHGQPNRYALELEVRSAGYMQAMLQQRHINLLDSANHVFLGSPKVAETMAFYTGLVTGPGRIAGDANPGGTRWANDISEGDLCMIFTADWRASDLRQFAPDLRGKLAMMPLPRFDPDDAPTASWGGTMMAIPRQSAHPQEARELAMFLTTDPSVLKANTRSGFDLIPPTPTRWADPMYHRPDPFYADDQPIDDLYINLARQLPPRYVTPFSMIASIELTAVENKAVDYREAHGEAGLTAQCQQWLNQAAIDLERRIQFGKFDD